MQNENNKLKLAFSKFENVFVNSNLRSKGKRENKQSYCQYNVNRPTYNSAMTHQNTKTKGLVGGGTREAIAVEDR